MANIVAPRHAHVKESDPVIASGRGGQLHTLAGFSSDS